MIEELDIVAMREEGLSSFRKAVETHVQSGLMPDASFVQTSLLKAMEPILKAVAGQQANPSEHIRIHIRTDTSPEGQLLTYTEAEGLTTEGQICIESFMDLTSGDLS